MVSPPAAVARKHREREEEEGGPGYARRTHGVKPLAVVVEADHALVALGAVPARLVHFRLAVAAVPGQLLAVRCLGAAVVPWVDVARRNEEREGARRREAAERDEETAKGLRDVLIGANVDQE